MRTREEGFIRAASAEDISPGRMLRVKAEGEWIALANLDGEFFAIADTCTHEDASLSQGVLKNGCVRCPLHGSRFDLRTGQPLEEPAEVPVRVYPVIVEAGVVYVGTTDEG